MSSLQGQVAEGAALLDRLRAAKTHGKQMFMRFSNALQLLAHPRLHGLTNGPSRNGTGGVALRDAGRPVRGPEQRAKPDDGALARSLRF